MEQNLTLYQRLKKVETLETDLKEKVSDVLRFLDPYVILHKDPMVKIDIFNIDVEVIQRNMINEYRPNAVLDDAILGNWTIEQSLMDLSQVNKGWRKILPWKKDEEHNQRLESFKGLISYPQQLRTDGVFYPDNLITGTLEVGLGCLVFSYIIARIIAVPNPEMSAEEIQGMNHVIHYVVPGITSGLLGPIVGFSTNLNRFNNLPIDQAIYLDQKIDELYNP